MHNNNIYAQVLLPLPVKGCFTYLVPESLTGTAEEGKRVVVPFGSKKLYAGLIKKIVSSTRSGQNIKEIISVLDDKPLILPGHFRFWEWVSDYYLCTEGEVMNAAMPAALKLSSETTLKINPGTDLEKLSFNIQETTLLQELRKKSQLTVNEAIKVTGIKKIIPLLDNLIEKHAIIAREFVQETYKPKRTKFVKLASGYEKDEEKLKNYFDYAERRAPRQLEALITFLKLSGKHSGTAQPVAYEKLLSETS